MTQTVVENDLREEAARSVALDVFTLIAAAEADRAEHGRVATLAEDATEAGTWWADIVEDVPDLPPSVIERGRWRLSLTMPGYVATPETISSGRPTCQPSTVTRAGVYTILDNLRNPEPEVVEFTLEVGEAADVWTELDHPVQTAAGVTVPANRRLGAGVGSDAAALEPLGWPASVTADSDSSRTITLAGSATVPGDRRLAVVGLRTVSHMVTPFSLGLIADWGSIVLTPPAGARRFVPEVALTYTSVAALARVFAGHDANVSRLAGWVPGSWEARESLERLSDACGRMVSVGADRVAVTAAEPTFEIVDVTNLTDAEIAHYYGQAGTPVLLPADPSPNDGYAPGSTIKRTSLASIPDGYANLATQLVTEEYLLYLAEKATAAALADLFSDIFASPGNHGVVEFSTEDPEHHSYRFLLGAQDPTQGDLLTENQHDNWFTVTFSGQIYQPGSGRIDKTNCQAVDAQTVDTDDSETEVVGPQDYSDTKMVTEETSRSTQFTESIEFENGVTVNTGDGIDSASDTLTMRFGFMAQQVMDQTTTKSETVEVSASVPNGQTWTFIYTVSRGGQECDVSINAVPDWELQISGGDGFRCEHHPQPKVAEYLCPGDVLGHDNRLLNFDSVGDVVRWAQGYDIRNLQMRDWTPGGLAPKAIEWLSMPDNRRIHFKGRESDLADSEASYRIEKATT